MKISSHPAPASILGRRIRDWFVFLTLALQVCWDKSNLEIEISNM